VALNGKAPRDPQTPVNLSQDRIEVDGELIPANAKTYLILNKPRGVVTTAADERGRKTVYDLLGSNLPWLCPVGRLDKTSE
jgi:23S rRNA pseudouridine2605 synthase